MTHHWNAVVHVKLNTGFRISDHLLRQTQRGIATGELCCAATQTQAPRSSSSELVKLDALSVCSASSALFGYIKFIGGDGSRLYATQDTRIPNGFGCLYSSGVTARGLCRLSMLIVVGSA